MKKLLSFALLSALALAPAWAQLEKKSNAKLQEIWNQDQQANQGYVWTINFHSGTFVSLEGLIEANYALHLSMSHVGPTMYGVYAGDLKLDASRDTKGFESLLAAMGGSLTTNGNSASASSDRYLCVIKEYSANDAKEWESSFGEASMYGSNAAVNEIIKDLVDNVFLTYVKREQSYEKTLTPNGWGRQFSLPASSQAPLQSAEISIVNGYMNAYASGTADLGATDPAKYRSKGWGRVHSYLSGGGYGFYDEDNTSPFPHTITVYPNGKVVFELYCSTGGPVTAKFYGTIDKVPVASTLLLTEKQMRSAATDKLTDESLAAQKKASSAVVAQRKAQAAAQQVQQQASQDAEASSGDAEVLNVWKSQFSMFPMWQGGHDLAYELYESNPLTATFSYHSDVDLWPAYAARLKAAGFAPTDSEGLAYAKTINGKRYTIQVDTYSGTLYDDRGRDLILRSE